MKNKTLFMETTKISPSQTVSEIQKLLGEHGATHILMEYKNNEVSGVVFNIRGPNHDMPFRLPCRWKAIQQLLDKKHPPKFHIWGGRAIKKDNIEQSKKVAWRQILRWVEAQLAFVETQMVTIHEVFMPYLIIDKNKTLYEQLESTQFKLEYKK